MFDIIHMIINKKYISTEKKRNLYTFCSKCPPDDLHTNDESVSLAKLTLLSYTQSQTSYLASSYDKVAYGLFLVTRKIVFEPRHERISSDKASNLPKRDVRFILLK